MRVFQGIENLFTLSGAAAKKGRKVSQNDLSLIEDGVIVEDKGRVNWIGSRSEFKTVQKKFGRSPKINLKAKTVLPAFLECHTHLMFAGDRANEFEMRNEGRSYQEISATGGGILSTVKATRAAADKELLKLASERIKTFAAQGISTVEIKSGYGLNEKEEIRLLKLIAKLKKENRDLDIIATYLGPHSRSPDQSNIDEYFNEIVHSTLKLVAKQKLAERADIFVENGFFTPDQGEQYLKAAVDLGFDITAHAEQLSRSGTAASFARQKAVSVDHLVHIDESDIKMLANSDCTCVLLPASDFYLKIAYPPARRLIENGARVSLSTDFNPGTSPTMDISFVGVLARLIMKMTLPEVVAAWTIGAAYALNRQDVAGSLDLGKRCDFVVSNENLSQFFYRVGHHPVEKMYLSGRLAFQR